VGIGEDTVWPVTGPESCPMTAPTAVRRSRLAAPPAAAWPHIAHGRFLADYLRAQLPAQALEQDTLLHGRDSDGHALTVKVDALAAPAGLTLILRGSTGTQRLHLALAACEGGSQLTITHEALSEEDRGPDHPIDPLAALLAAPLPAALRGPAVGDPQALAAAQVYLSDSARAVTLLRAAMAADQGYRQPAPDRFSLAAHLWHLADVEEFGWSIRLPRALAEHEPVLAGVDGDRLAVERRYQQRPWRGAAQRFTRLRQRSLQTLARFDATALARPLQFGGARISAGQLIAAMLAHDHEHRLEMAALWPPHPTQRDKD
jgi:hypothetical protein